MSLAIIHLYGNPGRDAELRYAQSGNLVLRFTVWWSPLSRQPVARNKLRWAEVGTSCSGHQPSRARVAAPSE